MQRSSPVPSIFGSAALPAATLIAMAFFGYYAILGPNGILTLSETKQKVAQREAEFAQLDHDRTVLRNRVKLLDPRGADRDMVDQEVRKGLNVIRPDEVKVRLRK